MNHHGFASFITYKIYVRKLNTKRITLSMKYLFTIDSTQSIGFWIVNALLPGLQFMQ